MVAAESSQAKLAPAHDLGAEATVDYTRPGRAAGAGGPLGTATVDADGGRFVTYGSSDGPTSPGASTVARRRPVAYRPKGGSGLCDAEGEAAGATVRTTTDIAVAQISTKDDPVSPENGDPWNSLCGS
ncbi:hypothetical protein Psuf_086000 [Phytohabitans suffuscus]|uniref:Uncharacterized protein n=1 Tax=Phytohabitans suffuscus TaxID=624315 RepID=A0A6F8YYR6_9ACTN|nr:hypothetical protein Psuf_086000 [Phytohabitans suffuscus]